MTTQKQTQTSTEFSIHPAAKVGHVSLTVASLENQIAFYQQAMGFIVRWRDGNRAGLGAPFGDLTTGGADLLRLTEQPNVKKYRRVTGLYHFAVLFPSRRELARAMARLFAMQYPNYPTDHVMTKTTYLDDPDGNGIELYAESPEDGTFAIEGDQFVTRRTDGTFSDGREPLDVDALLRHLKKDDRLDVSIPKETRLGHVHLHVRNVNEAVDFYHGVLGFDVMGVSKSFRAAFVSAGGYHHHLGLNTWQGEGAPPPPPDAVGLRYFTVELPDQKSLDDVIARVDAAGIPSNQTENGLLVHDPSQNGVMLTIRPGNS
ncbi:MAG: VOC family protein [Chloroflexi bacterium]|nr:VOC family protein [Chloroflexota bacterium]